MHNHRHCKFYNSLWDPWFCCENVGQLDSALNEQWLPNQYPATVSAVAALIILIDYLLGMSYLLDSCRRVGKIVLELLFCFCWSCPECVSYIVQNFSGVHCSLFWGSSYFWISLLRVVLVWRLGKGYAD